MHHAPLQQHQHHHIMSADGLENDEDLVLFQEVQKREREAIHEPMAPPLRQSRPDVVSPEDAGEDIFAASEWDEHDYDWLMTPPVTPPLSRVEKNAPVSNGSISDQSITVKNASKSIAKVGGDSSGARPLAQAVRRSSEIHKPAGSSVSLATSTSSVSRKSLSTATRSSTPSRSSTSVSRPIARPSPPSKCVPLSASERSSTPTGRAASPSHRLVSSTRPLTPIKRPATPTRVNGPLPASLKPSSVNKTVSLSVKSASAMRPSGPATRAQLPATHSAVLSELPHESPPKLHSSAADRPHSNPRGSLALKHNVKTATAKATQPRSAEVCLHNRGSSSLSMVARGRVSSKSLNMEKASSRHEKPHNAAIVSNSHGAGSKIIGKNTPPTQPFPLSQGKARCAVNTPAKKTVQTTSPCHKQTSSVIQQSTGFGRKMSKSSLEMALRHMDIQGSTPSGVRSFMSNVPKSSLYSVSSRNSRGISNGRENQASLTSRSPMATSSNASSERSMSVAVIDLESSDFDDETPSSKASPVSQPDPSMAMANDKKVSFWLGGPGYMGDDGADILKNFEHELASLSGTESPLVSQPDGNIDVDDFTLEPI